MRLLQFMNKLIHNTILTRLAVPFLMIAALAGCTGSDVTHFLPETDRYYVCTYDGNRYLACIDSVGTDNAFGHYYAAGADSAAVRQHFTMSASGPEFIFETAYGRTKIDSTKIDRHPYFAPAFKAANTRLYLEKKYQVKKTENVVYGNAYGYWSELEGAEAEVTKIITDGFVHSFQHDDIELEMDIYQPVGLNGPKPLIMFIHGGAFYIGCKNEPAYIDFCEHFASMGYVTASINYRLGFHLGKGDIERAAYMALQDAHAAMRYLVANAKQYGINTEEIYVAGSSAGGITALNMAFMKNSDRPASSFGAGIFRSRGDLGNIDDHDNDLKASFKVKAIANMWGAVNNLDILKNGKTSIISFYGDQDTVVPFGEDYPFKKAGKAFSKALSEKMYGSVCIDEQARKLGIRSEIHAFPGEGHALNTTGKDKQPNLHHKYIKDKIASFFYKEMAPSGAKIKNGADYGTYSVEGRNISTVQWKVEGGFILSANGKDVQVLWIADSPVHCLTATGTFRSRAGFLATLDEK